MDMVAHIRKCKAKAHNINGWIRKRGVEGRISGRDIIKQLKMQGWRCYYCRCFMGDSFGYTVDHVVPLSHGGSNWPDNIVMCCEPCNVRKAEKIIDLSVGMGIYSEA